MGHTISILGQAIPPAEPRIPQKQLLIEMASMIKQHVRSLMNTEVKSVIKPLPKYTPSNQVLTILTPGLPLDSVYFSISLYFHRFR